MPSSKIRETSSPERSDGQYRPPSSSRKPFDLLRVKEAREYANSVQSGKNRGKLKYDLNTDKSVSEDGKPTKEEIVLSGKYGLKGGMDRDSGSTAESRPENYDEYLLQNPMTLDDIIKPTRKAILDRYGDSKRNSRFALNTTTFFKNTRNRQIELISIVLEWNNLPENNNRDEQMKRGFAKGVLNILNRRRQLPLWEELQ